MARQWIVAEEYRDLAADRYHKDYKPGVIQPVEAVIFHYTVSKRDAGTRRELTAADGRFVSCHFLVERSGVVRQMIPLDERGAHAGGATSKLYGGGNVNGRTLGVEIVNLGPLTLKDDLFLDAYGQPFSGAAVSAQHADPRWAHWTEWEAYSTPQIEALEALTTLLVFEFPILGADPEKRLLGHMDVDPTRKADPGPHFPWTNVREQARAAHALIRTNRLDDSA